MPFLSSETILIDSGCDLWTIYSVSIFFSIYQRLYDGNLSSLFFFFFQSRRATIMKWIAWTSSYMASGHCNLVEFSSRAEMFPLFLLSFSSRACLFHQKGPPVDDDQLHCQKMADRFFSSPGRTMKDRKKGNWSRALSNSIDFCTVASKESNVKSRAF